MARGGKNSGSGRPRAVPAYWEGLAENLKNATWTHKGLSGDCPFCGAAFEPQKMRFLIFFQDNGGFKSYNCFICQERGSGLGGLSRLNRQVGAGLSFLELAAMVGPGGGASGGLTADDLRAPEAGNDRVGERDEGAPIDWPPPWVRDSDEVFLAGIEYMEGRGILDAARVVDRFGLLFSEVVEVTIRDEALVRPFPCVVAPMAGRGGEVYGWTTRRLGEPEPGESKAIAMAGRGWRNRSLFGIREVDPSRPVAIVEGVFSALATPNSVAIGGKDISTQQLDELAATGAPLFVFALDPFVPKVKFANAMYRLRQKLPGSSVISVEWERFGGDVSADPADRGMAQMREIIAKTCLDKMKG